jgi:hypothetical protein
MLQQILQIIVMAKLTFREAFENGLPWYYVAQGGSIKSYKPIIRGGILDEEWLDKASVHLTEDGKIDRGWGYAVFANAEDAAEMAKKIVTMKYNNSIEKIRKVTRF